AGDAHGPEPDASGSDCSEVAEGEPALSQRRGGGAGGVAAGQPPPKGTAAVELRSSRGSIAGVFEEDEGAVGSQDPVDLANGAGLLVCPTQRDRGHDRVEGRVVEGQVLD